MEQIKAGLGKLVSKRAVSKKVEAKYEEATLEDSVMSKPIKKVAKPDIVEEQSANDEEFADVITKVRTPDSNKLNLLKIPTRIEVKQALVKSVVPGYVFRCPSFKWQPSTFVTESEQLNQKFIDSSKQTNSLEMFLNNPSIPVIYSIAGNPDDAKAKLFAAYLVSVHMRSLGSRSNVIWESLYGGFENKLVSDADDKEQPTMIVITNLCPNSTNLKLEKAKDILEKFADIPRIVVSSGLDPISFMTTKLYSQVNALAYFSDSLIRAQMTII
jgi:hypothetical protein